MVDASSFVERWIFEATSIGQTSWHEIEDSGPIKLVTYATDNGFKRNHILTRAVVVGDGSRTARKQHPFEKT